MTQNKQLLENYEDAVFAILMDAVAEQEGEKGLQLMEELERDPSAQVPERLQEKAKKTIRKAFAAQGRQSAKHISFRIFQRIAVAVLVIVLTTVCAFAAFPEVRSNVVNTIIRICEDHTDISFTDMGEKDYTSAGYQITPNWLPEGFELSEEGNTSLSIWKLYQDDGDGNIYISMTTAENNSMAIDTENAEVSQIKVNGYDGTLVRKDEANWNCVVFLLPEKDVVIYIDSEFVNYQDMLRVAEELSVD